MNAPSKSHPVQGASRPSGSTASPGIGREIRRWLIALLMLTPATIPYAIHYADASPRKIATGFVQPDMPYYMANAREHFDQGFHLSYGLRFTENYETPRVYFQPQTLLLGVLLYATGWEPGTVFVLFGFVSGWVGFRLILAVFEALFGLETREQWVGAWVFAWGGGVLVLTGLPFFLMTGNLDDLFRFDPGEGLWFLNLGRNFIYPTEAYYHALFFGALLLLLRGRYGWHLAVLGVLSLSHPFTGIEALLLFWCWGCFERFWIRQRVQPGWWLAGLTVLVGMHLGYYFGVLNLSPEHREIQQQWKLDWSYQVQHFLPAYFLVGLGACWQLRSPAAALATLTDPRNRLFLVWFLVAFALANHEFALKPSLQPLHFTRGYVWSALFLLGCPAWLAFWRAARTGLLAVVYGLVLLVFFSDNLLFLPTYHYRPNTHRWEQYLDPATKELLGFLQRPTVPGTVVLSPAPSLNYTTTVYTPLRTYFSHPHNTPAMEERQKDTVQLLVKGIRPEGLRNRPLLIVFLTQLPVPRWLQTEGREVFRNDEYVVFRVGPEESR